MNAFSRTIRLRIKYRGLISELRSQILDPIDLVLFDETKRCFEIGAYRAGQIMIWLAIAESLKSKFQVMANRDAEVGKITAQIRRDEQLGNPTDKFLLDKALELGILSKSEYAKLEYIRNMRNIYAHPTGAEPTPEELISSMVNGVRIVLRNPPLLRYGYVERLINSLFADRHFLEDDVEKVALYSSGVFRRIHPEVFPYLFKRLSEELENVISDPELGILGRRGLAFGTEFLKQAQPDLSSEEWDIIPNIQSFPKATSLILCEPELWPDLSEQAKNIVLGNLIEPYDDKGVAHPPESTGLAKVYLLYESGMLGDGHYAKMSAAIRITPFTTLETANLPLRFYATKIEAELKTHNWYRQNPAAEALLQAGPQAFDGIPDTVQESLGRNIMQSAHGSAGESIRFLNEMNRGNEEWPQKFVMGLLAECLINDAREYRFKGTYFKEALEIANSHTNSNAILDDVTNLISESSASPMCRQTAFERSTVVLQEVQDGSTTPRPEIASMIQEISNLKDRTDLENLIPGRD